MENITVVPISHASLVLKWGDKTIYADPIGDVSLYQGHPDATMVLVTHEHGDHFSISTLQSVVKKTTVLVVPQSVYDKLPEQLQAQAKVMKNGDGMQFDDLHVEAIPAYNVREEAKMYHPQGRDNGYVLEGNQTRVYIAGDTEGTPEMRALADIAIAFIPMNLPYTMSVEDAANAVLAFKPKHVYPYHYRGTDGLSDIQKFKELVHAGDPLVAVVLADWYEKE